MFSTALNKKTKLTTALKLDQGIVFGNDYLRQSISQPSLRFPQIRKEIFISIGKGGSQNIKNGAILRLINEGPNENREM